MWKTLLILALILCSTAIVVGVAVNVHIAKPAEFTASPVSAGQPVLRDPIDTDVPGGVHSVALEVNAA